MIPDDPNPADFDPSKPLSGIRVLDLTNVLSGPFACHQLAHLGADVIKIERPGSGDLARQLGADPDLNAKNMGVSFLAQNAGKASVCLNLKDARGVELLKRLAAEADVLVENYRPGVMERLGVGAETLRAVNPQLIYCAISGFGQDGPWKDRPAYDQIVQGLAGVMSVTGAPDGDPLRVGFPIADTVGGLTAAFAITAALNAPKRGCVIDVSMLEATLSTMAWAISNFLIAGVAPQQFGNENPTSAPSGAFRAADGFLNIAANKDQQWTALAQHLGRDDLLIRPDFATREDRKRNRLVLRAELETVLVTRPAADWARELNDVGVPAGAIMTVPDILSHSQITERGFLATYQSDSLDMPIRAVRTGIKMNDAAPHVADAPPALGADTARILGAIGVSEADLKDLKAGGVI
ncbi:CaiB/BaiF CoA transferase family protein [Litoreibacter roseus]|uniref:CoA transferase n=1 Tax=Litoreibacter roseus TaxID=2601869 RepID=A0A6N6JCN6_9RHOB|nr:CoA transferase [Litoreibacter roseus]GFE64101.1 CoA transferase [Litoreibacter roseus]